VFGDATEWLPQLTLAADAFYLDGFAPDRNPELWSEATLAQLRRLAAPGATLATWSVADDLTRRIATADFSFEKRPGFGNKRYMLAARAPGTRSESAPADRRIVVIGAGAAGSSAANRLAARGYQVTVLERAREPAGSASGNKAGVFRPLPSLDDTRQSRLLRACFLYGLRHVAKLPGARYRLTGALHIARDAKHEDTQRRTIERQQTPPELARYVDRDAASQLAGWPVAMGGWWFAGAGWINPPSLCAANLAGIATRFGIDVVRMERTGSLWRLFDASDALVAEAPRVVLATASRRRSCCRRRRSASAAAWSRTCPKRRCRPSTSSPRATATSRRPSTASIAPAPRSTPTTWTPTRASPTTRKTCSGWTPSCRDMPPGWNQKTLPVAWVSGQCRLIGYPSSDRRPPPTNSGSSMASVPGVSSGRRFAPKYSLRRSPATRCPSSANWPAP
jgi:hypothetical protein